MENEFDKIRREIKLIAASGIAKVLTNFQYTVTIYLPPIGNHRQSS